MPKSHPLNSKLKALLTDPGIFDSKDALSQAGFDLKGGNRHLLVAGHPSLEGFLIKKFCNDISNESQVKNYLKRIKGAKKLKDFFKEQNFDRLTVPDKWLYELPSSFTLDGKTKAYLLVVTKMDIYEDWRRPDGENRKRYYDMDKTTLRQLTETIHKFKCDPQPRNQPFTHDGKIAFIDTEHVDTGQTGWFVDRTVSALSEENKAFAVDLWNELNNR